MTPAQIARALAVARDEWPALRWRVNDVWVTGTGRHGGRWVFVDLMRSPVTGDCYASAWSRGDRPLFMSPGCGDLRAALRACRRGLP